MEGINGCLKRLQLDYVDIIMAHRPDPWTPMEEVVRSFTQMINDGKAFYWGTSEWSAFEIEHAHHIASVHNLIAPSAEQPEYNLFSRQRFESEYEPLYRIYGYGTTTFSPLASGLLSGKYNNGVPEDSRLAIKTNPLLKWLQDDLHSESGQAKIAKVKELSKIAEELNGSVAALSLAWLLKNPNVSSVITGASKPEQVTMIVKVSWFQTLLTLEAMDMLPLLTDEIMDRIEKIVGNKPAPKVQHLCFTLTKDDVGS
jgi:aryl-alcohol dehydrogenase-like predicted oxidoreductase